MTSSKRHSLSAALVAVLAFAPTLTMAQMQPGQSPMPQTPKPEADKPEGPAEAAPKNDTSLPTTPILPPRKSERAGYQLFELDGYFRWRGDWLNKFNLGFRDDETQGGAPFPTPLACADLDPNKPCRSKFKSSNLRLRLEPVISLQENATQIFMQIDVLDNLVLGSTPTSFTGDPSSTPGGISEGAAPPVAGQNSSSDSLKVKRAWAEVETSLGRIHFGRMPWDWGLGIYANGGGRDPIHGTYDLDSDYGTTVDRLQFSRQIPGTDLDASIAMDWTSSYPSSEQLGVFSSPGGGQPFDLEDNDDVNQWVFTIARMDRPKEFQERVDRGEMTLNYGAFFAYRTQSWEQTNLTLDTAPDPLDFVRRGVKAYIPNVWLRLAMGAFDFELEGVGILGKVDDISDMVDPDTNNTLGETVDLVKFGAVARGGYKLLEGDIRLGLELGYASGDQWDNLPAGRTNVRNARVFPGEGDTSASMFRFNFDYEVDMILFRELIGTVSNATYVKPTLDWKVGGGFRAQGAGIVSFANVPVATPGNSEMYGVELNADFGYEKNGFFAGIAYGVLFPLGALDHPTAGPQDGPGFGFGANSGDAETAQTIQSRLMLRF